MRFFKYSNSYITQNVMLIPVMLLIFLCDLAMTPENDLKVDKNPLF